jgi:branched-chain amino acid transport system permease protein
VDYLLHILILIGIYTILSVSLNLISGYTGLLSVAQAALYGVGAYIAALLALHFHLPFLVGLVCAALGAAVISVIIAAPSLRVHDDYFVLATFAFQVIAFGVMNNWVNFTGGPMGLPGIPQPVIFGITISTHWQFLFLAAILAALAVLLVRCLVRAPFGRVLRAIREDEVFAQSLGKNVIKYKLLVFVIGGALAAVAGALYAHYISFIDPTSFTVQESIFILAIVIVGGSGSIAGSIVGAVALVALPEALRFIGLPSSIAANVRQILYGGALVACMMFRPQGILGEFSFRKLSRS